MLACCSVDQELESPDNDSDNRREEVEMAFTAFEEGGIKTVVMQRSPRKHNMRIQEQNSAAVVTTPISQDDQIPDFLHSRESID